ncbi:MAG TPA: flagellar basal body L-ring protein FlgH, partial [bacterium]|nr:flagellar basal body L-ring protein FlgH [bacterium]
SLRVPCLGLCILALFSLALEGCAWLASPSQQQQAQQVQQATQDLTNPARLRTRPPINTTGNLYEGSLWRGPASWGNLLRDHRARYVGDLLTVNEVSKVIKVPPETKPEAAAAEAAAQGKGNAPIDPLVAFLREQARRQADIEREQNDILRSIQTIEVEVVRLLPNGNMVVRGAHAPIYRDRNNVKYVITLQGVARPYDVDETNAILATKISNAEYAVHRLVKRTTLPVGDVARAVGKPKEGALLDRLTDFVAAPAPNRTTQLSTK